jgi:hypothetical protein
VIPGLGYSDNLDWYNTFPEFAAKNKLGLTQVIAGIGIWEGHFDPSELWSGGGREAGKLGFDPLNLSKVSHVMWYTIFKLLCIVHCMSLHAIAAAV